MRITYDEEADAMYIYFSELPVADTKKVGEGIFVDLDREGVIRGLEILSPIGRGWVRKDKLLQLETSEKVAAPLRVILTLNEVKGKNLVF